MPDKSTATATSSPALIVDRPTWRNSNGVAGSPPRRVSPTLSRGTDAMLGSHSIPKDSSFLQFLDRLSKPRYVTPRFRWKTLSCQGCRVPNSRMVRRGQLADSVATARSSRSNGNWRSRWRPSKFESAVRGLSTSPLIGLVLFPPIARI